MQAVHKVYYSLQIMKELTMIYLFTLLSILSCMCQPMHASLSSYVFPLDNHANMH